ncbi:MAG TPA: hypothetical protein VN253_02750 [Kofleriaceae bacterium]|nr:hypothetical protein [Kofleriaceae bacterium]
MMFYLFSSRQNQVPKEPETGTDIAHTSDAMAQSRQQPSQRRADLVPVAPRITPDGNVYNPLAEREARNASAREIVQLETRDKQWAEVREKALLEAIESKVTAIPGNAAVNQLECRTSSCELVLEVDNGHTNDVLDAVPSWELGDSFGISLGGTIGSRSLVQVNVLFTPENRDHQNYSTWRAKKLSITGGK